ncbi:MAG: RDD family protein [Gemmatimonadota bacterium]
MKQAAGRTDPRTIITPDAFSVAPELLNLPLAHPWRRAAAILIDLVLVAILANVPAVFFALAAGLFVFWLAVRGRRGEDRASTGGRVVRTTFGCLGAVTLVVAALAISSALFSDSDTTIAELESGDGRDIPVSAAAVSDLIRLARGGDSAEVAAAAGRMVERLSDEGVRPGEMRELVGEIRGEGGGAASRALDELDRAIAVIDTVEAVDADTLAVDSLLSRWMAARAADDSAGMARFGPPLGAELAAEALEQRAAEIEGLEGRVDHLQDALDETERTLEEERNRGILASVYAVLDDVGLSLGWAGLYFTFFLGFWKGRTPGKRLLGVRVVRLDGRPLGYWVSFERYGGYAASLFTGLEGFARIFWDPNRQALEDRLAGTVVVRETPEARERIARLHEGTAAA